eukprot:1651574-Amphidinium_carterae.1
MSTRISFGSRKGPNHNVVLEVDVMQPGSGELNLTQHEHRSNSNKTPSTNRATSNQGIVSNRKFMKTMK